MKLFLRRTDKEELIFIPSYLLVDNFEKLLRKKDYHYKQMILHFIIEFLLLDKKKIPNGFDIDFSAIEEKSMQVFIKSDEIDGKLIRPKEDSAITSKASEPKENFLKLYENHLKIKEKSGVITFEHIFKNNISRNIFLSYLETDFKRPTRKEKVKDIEKHIIGSSLFYSEFYEKFLKNSNWFKNYKKKDVFYSWLAENIANYHINKKEDISIHNKDSLEDILLEYFSCQQSNFPVVNFEDKKKQLYRSNEFVLLSKKEKNEELKLMEENYETEISEYGLNVLFVYLELAQKSNIKVDSSLIGDFLIKILKSNIFGGTDFKKESQFLFNQNGLIEFIKEEEDLLNSETLVYLESCIENTELIVKLYEEINSLGKIKLNLLLPIIKNDNSLLSNKIIENHWLDLVKLVTKKFSEKSHTYERVLTAIINVIPAKTIQEELLVKSRMNFPLASKFLDFYKKKISKSEYITISQKIISEVSFKKFENKKKEYFELVDSDVLINYFLNTESKKLNEFTTNEGLLGHILKLKNKYLIPKLLASFQLVDINIFDNFPDVAASKYFWTAFEFNLKDKESVSKHIELTNTKFFRQFVLRSEGVDWLKSETGTNWLSMPESNTWKQSPDGIFIQRIVLENQTFFIETKEVFDSYVEILRTISKEKIDDAYLINNVPETFNYLLKKYPESILLINFENFDRFSELAKIINHDKKQFLESRNKDIVLKSVSCLLHVNSHKLIKNLENKIDEDFQYFYEHNTNWFASDDFSSFIRKHKSEKIFEKLFKESKNGLSETTQQISENLIKSGGKKYLELIIKSENIPFWLTKNVAFVELIKKSSKEARIMVNLLGYQFFQSGFRKSAEEHREWFTEFTSLFAFTNRKSLKLQLIASLNKDCNSKKCKTRKTGKEKEGFRDFYDVFLAIAFYSNSFNTVQRPYKCTDSKLWHKTSDWG